MKNLIKYLFYIAVLTVIIYLTGCSSSNLTKEEKKAGLIVKGKKHFLYKGNMSKYSYFGSRKKSKSNE